MTFHHPGAFWFGMLAVTAGVIAHIPMYLMGKDTGYRLVGMPMDTPMLLGMAAIVVGTAATLYGLYPSSAANTGIASPIRVRALDDAPRDRPRHARPWPQRCPAPGRPVAGLCRLAGTGLR